MFLEQLDQPDRATHSADAQTLPIMSQPRTPLPSMADLAALEDELNAIDATLAELQD